MAKIFGTGVGDTSEVSLRDRFQRRSQVGFRCSIHVCSTARLPFESILLSGILVINGDQNNNIKQ